MIEIVMAVFVLVVSVATWFLARRRREGTETCALCERSFDSTRDLEAHLLKHGRIERPTLGA